MKNEISMEEVENAEETTLESLTALAELEAEADHVVGGDVDAQAEKALREGVKKSETETAEKEETPYRVDFNRAYTFDAGDGKKEYRSIDLSGLVDLTTRDLEFFDRVLAKLNHNPDNKYRDATYCKYVAMRVTDLPVDFFNALGLRDMLAIVAEIYRYFLFG